MDKVKVLIVDDSAVVRKVISDILQQDPSIDILGTASDPIFAMNKMEKQWPDVILLDLEMPRMDGLTFLRKIMSEHPTPVIICSTLTSKGMDSTMQALSAGAVEVLSKPKVGLKTFLQDEKATFLQAIKSAAKAKVRTVKKISSTIESKRSIPKKLSADVMLSVVPERSIDQTTEKIIVIGTSTGGTQALELILTRLPRVIPGIVIVQHMPEKFTAAFANRLNGLCEIDVKEASNGDRVLPGRALIAPGGKHMMVRLSGAQYNVEVADGPLVNRHRPSVDVLFRSAAKFAGRSALGVILTGMGDDGARGLLEMRDQGANTIAQDENSSVVFGMPREAIKLGAAEKVVGLNEIAEEIMIFSHSQRLTAKK